MKNTKNIAGIAVVVLMALVLLTAIGCDEGMNMAGDVIGSVDPVDPVDPTMNGEVKDPDPTMNGGSTDPVPPSIHPSLVEESVTHYKYSGDIAAGHFLPPSAWVLDFPGPYRRYTPPESGPEDFVGRVCMRVVSISNAVNTWAADDYVAPVSNALVTITDGPRAGEQVTTDEGGYYLFPNVAGDKLYLRVERAYLEPKEVIAYRSGPTTLQELRPNEVFNAEYQNRERLNNSPGMVLMGLRWPDTVRFILEDEPLPHDLLCVMGIVVSDPTKLGASGLYGGHTVLITNPPERSGKYSWDYKNILSYRTLTHELAHARQHAVAIMHGGSTTSDWKNTPEGKAYREAWEKDLEEIPYDLWLGTLDKSDYFKSNILENAAEFCAMYFEVGLEWNYEITRDGGIRERAPNRFQWAETYVNTQYN